MTGDWEREEEQGGLTEIGLVSPITWSIQAPELGGEHRVQILPCSVQESTPHTYTGFHSTPLPSSPPGNHTPLPEPHLAGDCVPLSHALDEGQELLLGPEQMEEEALTI